MVMVSQLVTYLDLWRLGKVQIEPTPCGFLEGNWKSLEARTCSVSRSVPKSEGTKTKKVKVQQGELVGKAFTFHKLKQFLLIRCSHCWLS